MLKNQGAGGVYRSRLILWCPGVDRKCDIVFDFPTSPLSGREHEQVDFYKLDRGVSHIGWLLAAAELGLLRSGG